MIRELVHVSANLRQDGGGAAHLGRVVGRAMRRYCSRHGLHFRGLHLPESDGHPALDGYDCFGGSPVALATRLWRLQALGGRERSLVFDHLGPSRAQSRLPGLLRSRYAVFLLGIEAWRALEPDRRRALAGARRLLAISRTTRERALPRLGDAREIDVVHPGLEPNACAGALDRELLAAAGEGFVLVVARLSSGERYKGHDELLAIWPRLRERVPDARLVIAGDGDDRPRLESRSVELGLGDAVCFVGHAAGATLAALYRRATLFAMPSRDEGFGLVFLEAMAAAKPCVALAATAPAEIVVDGETGRLVSAGDAGALADALAELLADPAAARRLGKAGRDRYAREFTFEAFETRFTPVLDGLALPAA